VQNKQDNYSESCWNRGAGKDFILPCGHWQRRPDYKGWQSFNE